MNEPFLFCDIPVVFEPEALLSRLHLKPGSNAANEFRELAAAAQQVARPKGGYIVGYIDERSDDAVVIDGHIFHSRILSVNLQAAHRTFAYMATCGRELHDWAASLDDVLHQFWAEELKTVALRAATQTVYAAIAQQNPGSMATMNPGSLADWPIQEQRPFFALTGELPQALGVILSDSYTMTPNKSVTGLRFSNQTDYVNCRLCPRLDCPGRAAPYDAELYARQYEQTNADKSPTPS